MRHRTPPAGGDMPIAALLKNAAFDPETVALLSAAFDPAWNTVEKSGSPLATGGQAPLTRERLAKRIIEMGQKGERDRQRLVNDALAHLAKAPDWPGSLGVKENDGSTEGACFSLREIGLQFNERFIRLAPQSAFACPAIAQSQATNAGP